MATAVKDRLASRVGVRRSQPEREAEDERAQAQDARYERQDRLLRLGIGLPAPPPPKSQAGFKREQGNGDRGSEYSRAGKGGHWTSSKWKVGSAK
jgi:hypothetical protein